MGLDITAYEQVKLLCLMSVELANKVDLDLSYTDKVLLYDVRNEALPEGIYRHTQKVYDFCAGSYGGYNEWRDKLAMFAHGVPARHIWYYHEEYAGKAFVELIHFSDCEGVLDSETCAKLAHDFAEHQDRADNYYDWWWSDRYNRWRRAFEFAANGGCVRFH